MGKNVIQEVFGIDVFNDATMREHLPKPIYIKLKETIEKDKELDSEIAGAVAHAMKEWALERGATHYTHWFQPMTGITAEKHDSFITSTGNGVIMEFSGKELVKGEPDASSFPSGGLRATFEARGYTTWDCTSPAFLKEDAAGVTLCIPTAFCAYTGESLDKKTPLLRSMEAISTQAVRIMKLFGHEDVDIVSCSVGAEQEYFLIEQEKYKKRDDLIFTGRTLFGAMPPKGQELDDHYFGAIKERVATFMKELNIECWKLGILAKTQHNEAAPSQHEMAPIFSTANIATDHNQLIMELMKKIAKRHGLECLLHEKPFAGVNGSGKHNNWSLITNTGKNLLSPGKTPEENLQFLLVLAAVIRAVDENAEILRESAANPGNDHRLGANEAPPAIISVYLGEQLEDAIEHLIETGEATLSRSRERIKTGVNTLPDFRKDTADRNRTSPFAFTGNKFEFRMVGSSMSIAGPNTVLNTIVAEVFSDMADELEQAEDFNIAVHQLIKRTFEKHQRVIFNGNGYSKDWVKEAKERGLSNLKTMVDAIPFTVNDKNVALFEKHHVFSRVELESRAEINYEAYTKAINIEARTMINMASKKYIPSVIKYTTDLARSINEIKAACDEADVSVQISLLKECSALLVAAKTALEELKKVNETAGGMEDRKEKAIYYKEVVFTAMEQLREPIDILETLVDKAVWPVPTYGSILFEV